ncbi:MAG: Hdr-like menaquinol oxidoreductase iron-sulfur subunit HmeA [Gammaproteobacteria bacterium]|nr:MAG: Hdr-like menaquinol oxidoreductase iron-sulfur subunit HmeA [Gammaproteobacteria bacterium]
MGQKTKQTTELANKERRSFLGKAAVATASMTLAPGVIFMGMAEAKPPGKPADEKASDKNRWGLLIDTNKCVDDCDACVQACNFENGLTTIHGPETDAQWIRKVKIRNKATKKISYLPLLCQHCEYAPCIDVCPTGASFRRKDGIVLVDKHICIGCRYCMMACPYKARSFVHETITNQVPDVPRGKGTVEACTMCVHKIDRGDGSTACVDACKKYANGAIIFGDLKDPNSNIAKELTTYQSTQLRPDLRLNTGVRYRGI